MAPRKKISPYRNPARNTEVFSELHKLQQSGVLCDVTLRTDDVSIPAHKAILASSSGYFRSMFTLEFREKEQGEILLGDMSGVTLEKLVDFLYTSTLDITPQNVWNLLPAAQILQLGNFTYTHLKYKECSTGQARKKGGRISGPSPSSRLAYFNDVVFLLSNFGDS